jgi:hypothetical protein
MQVRDGHNASSGSGGRVGATVRSTIGWHWDNRRKLVAGCLVLVWFATHRSRQFACSSTTSQVYFSPYHRAALALHYYNDLSPVGAGE